MKKKAAFGGPLLWAMPGLATAHGEEAVIYWLASDALLLVAAVLGLLLWRERMRTKLLLCAILVLAAAGTNAIPFLPGSLSFMAELGPIGLLLVFAALPLAVAVAAYVVMRLAGRAVAQRQP